MKTLVELERIATTVRHSLSPPRKTPRREPRRERRARDREQLRQMKKTTVCSNIQVSKRGKILMGLNN